MAARSDAHLGNSVRNLPGAISLASVIVGSLVLIGWGLNISALTSVFPGLVTMKPNTALALIFAGASLWLMKDEDNRGWRKPIGQLCAVVVELIGFLTLCEYIFGVDLRIDEQFFREATAIPGVAHPARIPPAAALSFTLMGWSLLLLDVQTRRGRRPAEWLALSASIISLLALICYAYNIQSLYGVSVYTSVALHTAACLFALSAGILLARADKGLLALFLKDSLGGSLARRILPAAFLIPFVLGWFRLKAEQAGFFSTAFGVALFAATNISLFAFLIWWNARSMDRADAKRQQAEGALREERARLAGIVGSAIDAIITVDSKQRIVLFNAAAEKMFRCPLSEALGNPLDRFIPERFRSTHSSHIRSFGQTDIAARAMASTRSVSGLRADGEEFPLEASISQVGTGDQKLYTVILRDITERERAEKRFHQVIERAPHGMVMVDQEAKIVLVNAQIEKTFGYERDELLGRSIEILIPQRFQEHHSTYRNEFMANPMARPMGSGRDLFGLRKDGGEFPVEIGLNPIVTDQGIAVLGTIVDITERKRAEIALRASEERFSIAFNASPISSVIATLDEGRYVAVNETFLKWTGFERDEVIGRRSADLGVWPTHEGRSEVVRELQADGQIRNRETTYRMKNGEERVFLMSAEIIELDGVPHIITASVDITESKRAEEEVRRLNEELERRVVERTAQLQTSNKELEAFSYSVSHDLRAPLRHINGFSQALLEEYSDKLDDVGKGYLEDVRQASREMAQLIDDLLQLARVTRSEIHREAIDLSDVARSVMDELQEQNGKRRSATVNIQPALSANGDRRLLRVMFSNLLGNAWKFSSKREHSEISFGKEEKDGEVCYFVRDNGVGFDMAYVNKLFGAFQRLHTVSEFEGTGIGLATVERVVSRHGGRVWAEAAVDKGATFYFTLPDSNEDENGESDCL